MRKNIKNQIFFIIVDIICIMIISLCFYLAKPVQTTSVVFIPQGNISQIITYLYEKKFDVSKRIDTYLLTLIGQPQAGWIQMNNTLLSKGDFLNKITKAKAATQTITIIPGETTYMVLQQLAQKLNLSFVALRTMYKHYATQKEGQIIPETYNIPMGISEEHLIRYFLGVSNITHERMAKKIFGLYEKNKWEKYIIIASIIQKEAGNVEEMPLVSSVIYNRLKKGMLLQMDGTLNYDEFSHTKITPKRIKQDNSKYNTYKYAGLPPSPICLVSNEAIKAAIFPKKSDYLYFVRDKKDVNGGHIFTKSLKAHNRAINKQR